jgi:DNA polymerase I
MSQSALFQTAPASPRSDRGYDPLPDLPAGAGVALDTETTGLEVRQGARAFCLSVATGDDEWCVPWNDRAAAWARDQLAGRDVVLANAKFDLGMLRADGLDLEALGVRPHEVAHPAALLDDSRRHFGLHELASDRLGVGKVVLPPGPVHELPIAVVAPYARRDARLTYDLYQSYQQDIDKEGLRRVLTLEDDLIYCTLSMEEVGCPLDMRKLEKWVAQVERARVERLLELWRLTGLRVNPTSGPDLVKLRAHIGMSHSGHTTAGGAESFTEEVIEEYAETSREFRLALEARQLASFLSKYLIKYRDAVDARGVLRYRLHQLRADEGGTITGRYASSHVNIQQVTKYDKQAEVLKPWRLRDLFVPERGKLFLDADMSQVEFRLFAHYADVPPPHSTRLAEEYRKDPDLDFHKVVMAWTGLIRSYAKNVNFAKLYGAQADKIAWMCGIKVSEAEALVKKYDAKFPEASRLMRYCERLAKRRGYVRTLLGRRRRYHEGDRHYSALNSVLQGGAADLHKLALLALYNELKKEFRLRATVHDEVIGDVASKRVAAQVAELLNEQRFALKVPVLWQLTTGRSWGECK